MFEAATIMPSINAIPDFVLSSVICANACVQIKTTCMVLTLGRSISAGACDGEMTIPDPNVNHRQEHLCTAVCAAPGICEIEMAPHPIEATFTGRNETFQYIKVRYLASSVCSGIDPLAVFSRFVGAFVYLPALIRNNSHETVEMCQTHSTRRYEAQGTSYPQLGHKSRSFLRSEVYFSNV